MSHYDPDDPDYGIPGLVGAPIPFGTKGDAIVELQKALINLGYDLPKYGADGDLGSETMSAVEEFSGNNDMADIPKKMFDEIVSKGTPSTDFPEGYCSVMETANKANIKGIRNWSAIDTIVLHQTGIWMTDTPQRFERLRAHMGILRDHDTPIVQVAPLTAYMYHANSLNGRSFGMEINGHFPGVEADMDDKRHTSVGPTGRQIESARTAIAWGMRTIGKNSGELKYIVPHRVSSMNRRSDPGEVAWREIGDWAIRELGLSDGGPGYKQGGRPLPYEWTDKLAQERYEY